MSEKLEQVIAAMDAAGDAYIASGVINDWRDMSLEVLARAAIAAMRVPTAAQGMAMYAAWDAFGENASMGPAEALALYQAAIDEVLK